MENLLITGAAGFIGSALTRKLVLMPDTNVIALDKLGYASSLRSIEDCLARPNFQFHKLDLCEDNQLHTIIKRVKPDAVFHLAAETHVDNAIKRPKEFIKSNVLGTCNLLEAWRSYDLKLTRPFIYVSTDEVYGALGKNDPLFTVESRYRPNNPYSASKASCDHLIRAWTKTYGLNTRITHCSNNFGPFQNEEKLIPKVITQALRNEIIPVYGQGKQIRDWLYVEDHVDALCRVRECGERGSTYLITANQETSNIQLVTEICSILDDLTDNQNDKPFSSLIRFVKDRQGHDFRYAMSGKETRKQLGWAPKISFAEALKSTVAWYFAQINDCQIPY